MVRVHLSDSDLAGPEGAYMFYGRESCNQEPQTMPSLCTVVE